jgi:hypothetical protein
MHIMTLHWKGDANGYIGRAGDKIYSVTPFQTGMGHVVYWMNFLDVGRVQEDPELLALHGEHISPPGLPIRAVEEAKALCEADYAKRNKEVHSRTPQCGQIISLPAARERLPARRRCETFDFDVPAGAATLRYTASIGRYPDGRVGEVFLTNHKAGSGADVNARDAAIAASFALQHGADIEDIRKALCRETDGRASGPLGAALDLISKLQQEDSQ